MPGASGAGSLIRGAGHTNIMKNTRNDGGSPKMVTTQKAVIWRCPSLCRLSTSRTRRRWPLYWSHIRAGKPHRGSNAFVTSHEITGIRAICYIPGIPTYEPTPSRPCRGLQARLRGIPGPLPTSRFSPHNSVHPSSAVHPSSSRLPLCDVTKPSPVALEAWRMRDSTVVLRYCPGSTTVAAPC